MNGEALMLSGSALMYSYITLRLDVITEVIRRFGEITSVPGVILDSGILDYYEEELRELIVSHNNKLQHNEVENWTMYDLINNINFKLQDICMMDHIVKMANRIICVDIYMFDIVSSITDSPMVICHRDPQVILSVIDRYENGMVNMKISCSDYCSYKLFKWLCKLKDVKIELKSIPQKPDYYDKFKIKMKSRHIPCEDRQGCMVLFTEWMNIGETYFWMEPLLNKLKEFDIYFPSDDYVKVYFPHLFTNESKSKDVIFLQMQECNSYYSTCYIAYHSYKSGILDKEDVALILPPNVSEWVTN